MAQAEHDSITRRAVLSGLAAVVPAAVTPTGVIAAPLIVADPIFAAIEAHVCAYGAFNAVLDALAVAEQAAWHAPRGQRRAANKRLAAAYAAEKRFGDIERDAAERFVATVPQTLQGAAAALRYVRTRYDKGYPMCEEESTMTLLSSTEQAICRAAGLAVPMYGPPASL